MSRRQEALVRRPLPPQAADVFETENWSAQSLVGPDIRALPLLERRAILRTLVLRSRRVCCT